MWLRIVKDQVTHQKITLILLRFNSVGPVKTSRPVKICQTLTFLASAVFVGFAAVCCLFFGQCQMCICICIRVFAFVPVASFKSVCTGIKSLLRAFHFLSLSFLSIDSRGQCPPSLFFFLKISHKHSLSFQEKVYSQFFKFWSNSPESSTKQGSRIVSPSFTITTCWLKTW